LHSKWIFDREVISLEEIPKEKSKTVYEGKIGESINIL